MAGRHNISKNVRFFMFDGLMLAPLLVSMLAFSLKLLILTVCLSIALFVCQYFGYNVFSVLRKIRGIITGPAKAIRSKERKFL